MVLVQPNKEANMAEADPKLRPFHTVTTNGGFVAGHGTEAQAQEDANRRNSKAEALELVTRYDAVPRP